MSLNGCFLKADHQFWGMTPLMKRFAGAAIGNKLMQSLADNHPFLSHHFTSTLPMFTILLASPLANNSCAHKTCKRYLRRI